MSIEDRIKVVKIGDNPNFTKDELKAEIIKTLKEGNNE